MTDSTTQTTTTTSSAASDTERETRTDVARELAIAEDRERSLTAALRASEQEVIALQTRQITDGGDDRLSQFWETAGDIANEEGFCEQYDRIAEEMNGPRRRRDHEVRTRLTVTVTITETVRALDNSDAVSLVDYTTSEVLDQIADNGIDDWSIDDQEVSLV